MCGITGFIDLNGLDINSSRSIIESMTNTLIHRGPDEQGYYIDQFAALGHRRLSIIDLSSGKQPMIVPNRAVIVFNGEIYNFQEIKKQLLALGYRFNTNSDTEVILNSYLEWDIGCLKKFIGMFSFAIWDIKRKRLFLARDRIGKKPLYYSYKNNSLSFSSEIKGLLKQRGISKDLDYEALDCYFTFGYIPSPRSIFRQIKKLEPGNFIVFDRNGILKKRYWGIDFQPQDGLVFKHAIEEFFEIFRDAVKKRMISDVPIGAFLSGGIDSSLVVSQMNEISDSKVLTNSIGFEHQKFNELPIAREIASRLNTSHREYTLRADISQLLPHLIYHLDEPHADSSAIPTYYVCKMAKNNCTVALSGDGGDESFGGYTFRYIPHLFESNLRKIIPSTLRRLIFSPLGQIYPRSQNLPKPLRLKTIFQNLAVSDEMAFYQDLTYLPWDIRGKIYSRDFKRNLLGFTPFDLIYPLYNKVKHLDPVSRAQFCDLNFYLPEDVLVKVDRMSMAVSLEVRSPLLDHRIIEFGAKLPLSLKIAGKKGKVLLRRAILKYLPKDIIDRPKQGFSIPEAKWLREELRPWVEKAVNKHGSIVNELFNMRQIKALWDRHVQKKENHSVFFWGIMILSLWEERFL